MNDRIRQMKEEIARRGGVAFVSEELPDSVAELFLQEILACPDCMEDRPAASGGKKQRPRQH